MANLSPSINFFTEHTVIVTVGGKEYFVDWSLYSFVDFQNFKSLMPMPIKYVIRGVKCNGRETPITKEITNFMMNFWLSSQTKIKHIISQELFAFMLICNNQRPKTLNFWH